MNEKSDEYNNMKTRPNCSHPLQAHTEYYGKRIYNFPMVYFKNQEREEEKKMRKKLIYFLASGTR